MYKEITLKTSDGGLETFPFRASGTTSIRFKMVFKKELMGCITDLVNAAGVDALGSLMQATQAATAEGKKEVGVEELDKQSLSAILKIAGSGEMDSISKMAYIMNKAACGADMTTLSPEDYFNWMDQFESMEFLTHAMDFIGLYMGNRETTAVPKKDTAQLTEQ